ncbi:Ig-like domain-containing protein [Micromonospora sp. SH-82]|uniref:L,D-transpeptidase n=1 Tax=Micromonospora sp. SH-82 TaxID=3132938 RepID=UPI003EBF0003
MHSFTRAGSVVAALALTASVALVGCGSGGNQADFVAGATPTPGSSVGGVSAGPGDSSALPDLEVTPKDGAKNRPVSTEIGAKLPDGGKVTEVVLTTADGDEVEGSVRTDGSTWVPSKPLKYGKKYTAKVVGTAADGRTQQGETSFTTMAKPKSTITSGLYLFDDKSYGVAMPVVAEFHPGIPEKDRAAVQKRMFVQTDPPQPGAWHWVSNGTQAYYRAPEYWKPGTTLAVRIALEGIPLSNGRHGNVDRTATAKIGRSFEMKVDNATKQMTVYEAGKVIKTMPVSLGKKSTPSSSGTMVVMEKKAATVFDTMEELGPEEGYVTDIEFAQRITWGGEYIHAAPWSVQHQGQRNVSHGCVNVSTENAKWLFDQSRVGDPITIKGTERKLAAGNGWTAWNLDWAEFVKGSALPVPQGGAEAALAL